MVADGAGAPAVRDPGTPAAHPGAVSSGAGSGVVPSGAGVAARFAGAAVLIAGLTVVSRLAGFARTMVFVWALGRTDLGDVYQTANTVPNIVFEIVAGGALASLVIPVLAGALARQDRVAVGQTTSALLTWVLTVLVPVAVAVAVLADPIVGLLDRGADPAQRAVGVDMLRVFAPQLPLYGLGIVLTGVLQAHRRFAWPVLAPLLSSVTVMVVYVAFAATAGRHPDLAGVGPGELLILSVGTTLGVAVLSLCLFVPLRPLRLGLRPTYALHADASRAVRRLAAAGALTVAAQQLTLGLAISLGNGGPAGSVVLYTLAQTVFLLPWAVLALPIATSSYPALAQAHAADDRTGYAATLAVAARGLVLLSCLGVAALAALAVPLAALLAGTTAGSGSVPAVSAAIAGFAPGLLGYALFALLSRALYARGDTWLAAVATVAGWLAVAGCSLALAHALRPTDRVLALALANSAGMLLLGALLLGMVARRAGGDALAGVARATLAGILGGGAALAAGVGVRWLVWGDGAPTSGAALIQGTVCGLVVGVVFVGVAYAVDRRDVRPLLVGLVRRLRSARARAVGRTGGYRSTGGGGGEGGDPSRSS